MLHSAPLTFRFFLFVFLPIILGTYWVYHKGTDSLISVHDSLHSDFILAPVQISRIEYGTTHISGDHLQDVFFAMGVSHAQDRLWQLEFQRRIAQGRLSELFGESYLSNDIWMRTLGLYDSANSAWSAISDEARLSLTAYAEGINYWLANQRELPPEFQLLGLEMAPWTELDSMAWAKVFALYLSGNIETEAANFIRAKILPSEDQKFLFDAKVENATVKFSSNAMDAMAGVIKNTTSLETQLGLGGGFVGSNAWVVAPHYMENNLPLLANDPHLSLQLPSLWYAVSQQTRQHQIDGFSLVGLPLVIFGKNQNIAWGGTNMMADSQDLYFEQVNPKNPNQYLYEGQWFEFETRKEVFHIKSKFPSFLHRARPPVSVNLRYTWRGPVLSDLTELYEQPVSMAWVALQKNDTSYEALYRVGLAQDWSEFQDALSQHITPALNFMYADVKGNIGFQAAGMLPIRKRGDGDVPSAGWNSDYDWGAYITTADLPTQFNPESGFIVNANNTIVDKHYPYFISKDWAEPHRANRISHLLLEKIKKGDAISLDYIESMQLDVKDISVVKIVQYANSLSTENARLNEALRYLKGWDGGMELDSVAATIYVALMDELPGTVFNDEIAANVSGSAGNFQASEISSQISVDKIAEVLTASDSDWCDNITSTQVETCSDVFFQALDKALFKLTKQMDSDMTQWRWGEVHTAHFAHSAFTGVNLLEGFFDRKVPAAGSSNTVNVANTWWVESEGYMQTIGAGFRQYMSMKASESEHYFINSTGQSGHFLSPHYDDQIPLFSQKQYLQFSKDPKIPSANSFTILPR